MSVRYAVTTSSTTDVPGGSVQPVEAVCDFCGVVAEAGLFFPKDGAEDDGYIHPTRLMPARWKHLQMTRGHWVDACGSCPEAEA